MKIKVAFVIVSSLSYFYFSTPGEVVVQVNGEVRGVFNKFRVVLKNKQFWKNQLKEIDKELTWELTEPERTAISNQELEILEQQFKKEDEQFYRDNPDMRPSPSEIEVEKLREQADAIEQAELDKELEQYRLNRIDELYKIRKHVEARFE